MSDDLEKLSIAEGQKLVSKMSYKQYKDAYNRMMTRTPIKSEIVKPTKDVNSWADYKHRDLEDGKREIYYFTDGTEKIYAKGKSNSKEVEEMAIAAAKRVADGVAKFGWSMPWSEYWIGKDNEKRFEKEIGNVPPKLEGMAIYGKNDKGKNALLFEGTPEEVEKWREEQAKKKDGEDSSNPMVFYLAIGGVLIVLVFLMRR